MKEARPISTPLNDSVIDTLVCGDRVLISGFLYSFRDAAHARLVALLAAGEPLPFDLTGQVIYYMGPSPAQPGMVIGAAGPTTAGRMDAFTPALLKRGIKGMIGKGARSTEVRAALCAQGAVYFAATGGAGALLSKKIKEVSVIAFEELGPEAIRLLRVEDFPAIVVNDIHGCDLYEQARKEYKQ